MAPAATPAPCCNPGCPDPLGGARYRGGRTGYYRSSGCRFGLPGAICKRCYNVLDRKRIRAETLKARAEHAPKPRKVFGQPWEGAEPLKPESLQLEERPSRDDMDAAYRSIRSRGTLRATVRPSRYGGQGSVSHLGSPASARAGTAAEMAAECVGLYRRAWPGLFAAGRTGKGVVS